VSLVLRFENMKNTTITAIMTATILIAGCGKKSPSSSVTPPPAKASAESGVSAYITAATNHVSTLSGLEFSVVITNSALTNVTIHPWILINGLGTVAIYDSKGMLVPYQPPSSVAPTAGEPRDLALKPGETYALKYKLGDHFLRATPSGKYLARGQFIPSNEVEISIE